MCYVAFGFILFTQLLVCTESNGQTLVMSAPLVERSNGSRIPTPLFKPTDLIILNWDKDVEAIHLKLGTRPGDYSFKDVRLLGARSATFTPGVVGLPVGVYYGVLTNATAGTFTGIQQEASADPSLDYTTEFKFAVESTVAPRIIGPVGIVATPAPTFEWEGIPGVQAYAVIVSSTPFSIGSNPLTGEPTVEGINLVWGILTTKTSVTYGEPATTNPVFQFAASPLVPGQTYNYSVLNSYSKTDAAFLSTVFGSVVAFTRQDRGTLPKPILSTPRTGTHFPGDETIRFQWEPVPGALSYSLSVFERIRDGGSQADVPIYQLTTANSSVDVPAKTTMRQGEFTWYVVANDAEGAASVSATRVFFYDAEMGIFTFTTRSAEDQSELLGVSVTVRSTDGGYNPPNAFVNQTSVSFSDSLVTGSYSFLAQKEGFADSTFAVSIRKNERTSVNVNLRPLPSRISGTVIDELGAPVADATVTFRAEISGFISETSTGFDGVFSNGLSPATYVIVVSKDGYKSSIPITVTVRRDDQINLPDPIVIEATEISVSGRVTDPDGIPVSLATVIAGGSTGIQTASTDGAGSYLFALSEGTWAFRAEKDGFVPSAVTTLSLVRGDKVQDADLILIQQASRISGVIEGSSIAPDGTVNRGALEGATVTASPVSGVATTTITDDTGRFSLDLSPGSYTVRVSALGHATPAGIEIQLDVGETIDDLRFLLSAYRSTVSGRVLSTDGSPVEGAHVISSLGSETISEQSGLYSLLTQPGEQTLSVRRSGFVPGARLTIAPQPSVVLSGIDLELVPNAAVIEGKITVDGLPLGGAIIRARSGTDEFTTESNATGDYVISVPSGSWTVTASAFRVSGVTNQPAVVLPGQHLLGVDIELESTATNLSGFVTDGQSALRGASILLLRNDAPTERYESISLSDGTFSVVLSENATYQVTASKEGFRPEAANILTGARSTSSFLSLELTPFPVVLSGRVEDPSGRPVEGATVDAFENSTLKASASTDFNGTYSLGLDPGTFSVRVTAAGFGSRVTIFSAQAGEIRTNFNFQLTVESATIFGTVRSSVDQSPLADVLVTLKGDSFVRSVKTVSQGEYVFSDVPEGSVSLETSRFGYIAALITDLTLGASETRTIDLSLSPLPGMISGRVQDLSGVGIEGVSVRAATALNFYSGVSNTSGEYLIGPLLLGEYQVRGEKEGYLPSGKQTVVLDNANPVRGLPFIQLVTAPGSVSGTVRDAGTRVLLKGALVTAISALGSASDQTDAAGAFSIGGLAETTYRIEIQAPGYATTERTVSVSSIGSRLDIDLIKNQGVVAGAVTDDRGQALPFRVPLILSGAGESLSIQSDISGSFQFSQLRNNTTYLVQTRIQRAGFSETSATVSVTDNTGQITLTIERLSGRIQGSVGGGGVLVIARDVTSNAVIATTTSLTDGSFILDFLPGGTFEVTAAKQGFTYTPESQTVSIPTGGVGTANFTASASIGSISVSARRQDGVPVASVSIRVTSEDRSVLRTLVTGSSGTLSFSDLPLDHRYIIVPGGFNASFEPPSTEVNFNLNSSADVAFLVIPATATISGRVRKPDGSSVDAADVSATNTSTGTTAETVASGGGFQLAELTGGTYRIRASRDGLRPSDLEITLQNGEQRSGVDLELLPLAVDLSGRVVRAGVGIGGIPVSLGSSAERVVLTEQDGSYRFDTVEVLESGSTLLQLRIDRNARAPLAQLIPVQATMIGRTIVVPDFSLPTGKITLRLTDGITPIEGQIVSITGPFGEITRSNTGNNGMITTSNDLDEGNYAFHLLGGTFLSPVENDRQILLTDREVNQEVTLPFRHEPVISIRSDTSTPIRIDVSSAVNLSDYEGHVFFRSDTNAPFSSLPLVVSTNSFTGSIPSTGEVDRVEYFVEVDRKGTSDSFQSPVETVIPFVVGRLTSTRVSPDLSGNTIRVGDRYHLNMVVRDGIGDDLLDRFSGAAPSGSISWTVSGDGVIETPDPQLPSDIILVAEKPGPIRVTLTATLQTVQIIQKIEFDAVTDDPGSLRISSGFARYWNEETSIPFVLSAESASGIQLSLGDALTWSVVPEQVGSISSSGVFKPDNRDFVGPVTIIASDSKTGIRTSYPVSLFARLTPQQSRRLSDSFGAEVFLPAGAFPFIAELSVAHPRIAFPKKYSKPAGQKNEFTAGDHLMRISIRSDRSLPGDSLLQDVGLVLPADPSLRLLSDEPTIARFDVAALKWRLHPSLSFGSRLETNSIRKLGEFGILSRNRPLSITHEVVLPSPFSPDVAPLKIGYLLESEDPPARVSIRIFNTRGDLIRTIIRGDLQYPGRYGSRTGLREIVWDGLTDRGKMARNGRYIIRIVASDQTETVTRLLSVVLVR